MSVLIQLIERIAVETPLGRGDAIFYESTTEESYWTVIIRDTSAFVTFKQKFIRAANNYTEEVGTLTDKKMKKIIKRKK
jgi:hypothetical protein